MTTKIKSVKNTQLPISKKAYADFAGRIRRTFAEELQRPDMAEDGIAALDSYLKGEPVNRENCSVIIYIAFAMVKPDIDKACRRSSAARQRAALRKQAAGQKATASEVSAVSEKSAAQDDLAISEKRVVFETPAIPETPVFADEPTTAKEPSTGDTSIDTAVIRPPMNRRERRAAAREEARQLRRFARRHIRC